MRYIRQTKAGKCVLYFEWARQKGAKLTLRTIRETPENRRGKTGHYETNKGRGGEPNPRHWHQKLWLLPSGPDQVHLLAMRGDPPSRTGSDTSMDSLTRLLLRSFTGDILHKQLAAFSKLLCATSHPIQLGQRCFWRHIPRRQHAGGH